MQAFRKTLYCIVLLCFVISSNAQESRLKFQSISVDEGLSQSIVTSFAEDSKGFIWVGTLNGLNRLVGQDVKIYQHIVGDSLSLSSNQIRCLKTGPDGKIWIGTLDAGLCVLDQRTDQFFRPKFFNSEGENVSGATINRIFFTSDHELWAAARTAGLFYMDITSGETKSYLSGFSGQENSVDITDVFYDHGELWLSDGGMGLFRFDPDSGVTKHLYTPNPNNGLHYNEVIRAIPGEYPWIWVGTAESFLHKVNRETGESIVYDDTADDYFHHKSIVDLQLDGTDSLWLATVVGGLQLFHIADEKLELISTMGEASGVGYNSINALFRASNDILWVGTNGKGLAFHHPGTNRFTVYSKSKPANFQLDFESVRVIYADEKWIFIGGYFGINRISRKTGETVLWLASIAAYSLCEVDDNPNLLLLGTEGGAIWLLDKENGPIKNLVMNGQGYYDEFNKNPHNFVYDIIHLEETRYAFGHPEGIAILDLNTDKVVQNYTSSDDPNSIVSGEIKTLVKDSNGQIWVGSTSGGLARYIPDEERFVRANKENGFAELPTQIILEMLFDSKNRFWVGTNNGLYLFDTKTGLKKNYTISDGMADINIVSIQEGLDNTIWCSTNAGLSHINLDTDEITNFNQMHGLPGMEQNRGASFKARDGTLFFGGVDGVVSFSQDPGSLDFPHPRPQIIRYYQYNEEIKLDTLLPYTNEVLIAAGQKYFSFEVTGTDFLFENQNSFRYSIPEISNEWIELGKGRRVSLIDTKPGTYHLKVQVSNDNSLWTDSQEDLVFKVKPLFHQTTGARVLFILFGLGLIMLIIYLRTRFLTLQSNRLNQTVAIRTTELKRSESQLIEANATKDRFFSIIAHDLKSPFSSLLGLSDLLSDEWDEYSDTEKKKMVSAMQGSLGNTYKLLINLLDWSQLQRGAIEPKEEEVHLYPIIQTCVEGFQVQLTAKKIIIQNKIPKEYIARADLFMVETIFRNLISNAIKYTPDDGFIAISAILAGNQLKCTVKDTGVGMDQKTISGLFSLLGSQSTPGTAGEKGTGLGLLLCKEFIKLMGGELSIKSKSGQGSSIQFSIPVHEKLTPL